MKTLASAGIIVSAFAGALFPIAPAHAHPRPGMLESWPGTSVQQWGGAGVENPGTGGQQGAGDGYLRVSSSNSPLATRIRGCAYYGDWHEAGITAVRFWLSDVGQNDDLEIHFAIGSRQNFWLNTEAFRPPDSGWVPFTVDLNPSANWVSLGGTGTFEEAMQNVEIIHLRHDVAPFQRRADAVVADFGIDELELLGGPMPQRARDPAPVLDRVEPGSIESWSGTGAHGWYTDCAVANPGTGGALGAGDGYLSVCAGLLAYSGTCNHVGDWREAGIDSLSLWLNDMGTDDDLEIHFMIGTISDTYWIYSAPFDPPHQSWARYGVNFREANWIRGAGSETFEETLRRVAYAIVLHDRPPYGDFNDPLPGADFAIDELGLFSDETTPIRPVSWGRLKTRYR